MDNPDPTYTKSNSIAKKKEAYKEGATKTSAVGQFSADQEQIGGGGRTGVEDLSMDEDNPSEQEVHGSYLGSTADGDSSTSSAVGAAKSSPATAGPGEDDQLAGQAAEDFLRGVPGIGEPPEEGFPQPTDLFLDDRSHRLAEDKPCRPSAPPSTSKAAGARRRDELDELAALREHCAEQVQVLQRRKEALEKTHVRRLRQMIKSTDIHPWRESQLRKEGWGDEEIEEERLKLRQNAGRNAVSMSLLELIGLDDEPEAFRMGRVVYDSFGCEEEIAADFLRLLIAAHERQSLTKPLTYDLALAHARRRGKSGYGRMNNPRHADLYDDLAAELFKGD